MMLSPGSYEAQILTSFGVVDDLVRTSPSPARLAGFRRRLVGELVFDADLVASTLTRGFELVSHAGGATTVSAGEAMVAGLQRQGEAGGASMWIDWHDLVMDGSLAGHGQLVTLLSPTSAAARGISGVGPDGLVVTSCPIAFFVRFEGELMASEVLYMDPRQTVVTVHEVGTMPTAEQLLALVGQVPSWT